MDLEPIETPHVAVKGKAREIVVPDGIDTFVPVEEVDISALLNIPYENLLNNIRINGARPDIQWIGAVPPHDGHAVLVGGGASLELPSQIDEVVTRKKQWNQTIFALNGAAKYLADRHIDVDYQVVMDARPETIKFLHGMHAKKYLIASQCDPSLFDYLIERGAEILMFHVAVLELGTLLTKGRHYTGAVGHSTVGLVAMSVVWIMGFRLLHLYGYDSSDSDDGRGHAYPQAQTEAEAKRLLIACGGRKFSCSFGMYKQAELFPSFAEMLTENGCVITVHGDGLLPTYAHQMRQIEGPESAACYNMAAAPASFDFIKWLVNAEMDRRRRGAPPPLRVAFTAGPEDGFRPNDVQNTAEKQQILDHVMRPALALFGAVEDENAIKGRQYHYWYRPITDAFGVGEAVPRCAPPLGDVMMMARWLDRHNIKPGEALVVTLRETRYSPIRNSNLEAWCEFATLRQFEGHKVVFVRDTAKADQPLDEFLICPDASRDIRRRAALYSLAKCNLLIANGPAELLQFSDWPFIEFKPTDVNPNLPMSVGVSWWQRFAGITPPDSFPWLGKHQLTVWKRDTIETIEDAWAQWLSAIKET